MVIEQLIEYEELNIFSRDDDLGTISNILIKNNILNDILALYKSLINDNKKF